MPQMSPMFWLILLIYFIIMMLMMIMFIFFIFFNIPSSSVVILKSNVSNWMW
uniref:ATP synthase F0 subunit 8 n=1 Tax=Platypedia putnami TaxID=324535 RepID=A0A3S7MGI7_9HEMI|nr:ATP synthase F0 subunit 8 [Platypedia putnami]